VVAVMFVVVVVVVMVVVGVVSLSYHTRLLHATVLSFDLDSALPVSRDLQDSQAMYS